MTQSNTGQPTRLTDGHILVGNSSNIATDVAMSGDVTITDTGVTTIKTNVALAGNPTTTTQSSSDNSTKIATTAMVQAAISSGTTPNAGTTVADTVPVFSNTTGSIRDTGVVLNHTTNALSQYVDVVTSIAGTTYTTALIDVGTTLYSTGASVCTITLHASAAVGSRIKIVQGGGGQVQMAAAAGATLTNASSYYNTRAQYSEIYAEVVANSGGSTAQWNISGDTGQTISNVTPVGGAIINSIQQLIITIPAGATSATGTITSVTTSRAYVHWQGTYGSASTFAAETCLASVTLTNATTVTATRAVSDASNSVTIVCSVVEFKAGVINRIQQGTIAIGSGATSNTAIITSVTTGNSFVHFQGQQFSATTDDANFARCLGNLVLTNATTVTAARNTSSTSTLTVGYVVVEFVNSTILANSTQVATISSSSGTAGASLPNNNIVDTLNTMTIYAGQTATGVSTSKLNVGKACEIAGSSTIVSAIRATSTGNFSSSGGGTINLQLNIITFLSGTIKSKQVREISITANNTTQTDTIQSVTQANTLVAYCGDMSNVTTFNQGWSGLTLASGNTVTSTRGANTANTNGNTALYQVIEFN